MKFFTASIFLILVIFVGCTKKQPASVEASQPATENDPAAAAETPTAVPPTVRNVIPRPPAPVAVPHTTVTSESVEGIVDPLLTKQLKKFIEERGRLPKDFRELANARLDSVPRLPEGLTYAIDATTQEVKVVKKYSIDRPSSAVTIPACSANKSFVCWQAWR